MFEYLQFFGGIRITLAHKLLRFVLKRKLDNRFLLKVFMVLFTLLTVGFYKVQHKKSRHHFVPQFILKNFKIGQDGLIYEYNVRTPFGKERSIAKHVCRVPNLYTYKDRAIKQPSDFIEDFIFANLLETYTPAIVRQVLVEGFEITGVEESILATFIAFQYTRTPKFHRQLNEFVTYLVKGKGVTIDDILDRNNFKNFFRRAFIENYYKVTRANFESFRTTNRLSMTGADNLLISLSIQVANYLAKPLHMKKDTAMIKANTDFFFITDHPVVIVNPINGEFMGSLLWEFKDMVVFMPLSPTRASYYYNPGTIRHPNYEFWKRAAVANYNGNVYSDRKLPELEALFKKLTRAANKRY